MGQNVDKILEVFYENPGKSFTVRELTKLTKVPRATLHKKLLDLKKQRLITKENKAESNLLFEAKKINYFIEKVIDSGLMDELIKNLNPSAIVLFGGIRKGESDKESDIDLFVESSIEKELDLSNFEKKLKHKIDLFVKPSIKNFHEGLFNNILNGIKLYGSIKIK